MGSSNTVSVITESGNWAPIGHGSLDECLSDTDYNSYYIDASDNTSDCYVEMDFGFFPNPNVYTFQLDVFFRSNKRDDATVNCYFYADGAELDRTSQTGINDDSWEQLTFIINGAKYDGQKNMTVKIEVPADFGSGAYCSLSYATLTFPERILRAYTV